MLKIGWDHCWASILAAGHLPQKGMAMASGVTPRVSFVIPAYNSTRTVQAAVRSIVSQTDPRVEVIVIDDGSSDSTVADLCAMARGDERIRVVAQANTGAARAANRGVELSRGEFLCLMGHDDLVAPEKVRSQLPILEADSRVDLVYSSAMTFRDERIEDATPYPLSPDGDWMTENLLRGGVAFPPHCALLRRTAFDAVGGHHESEFLEIEDTFLWLRMALNGARFAFSGDPPALYRRTAGARTADMAPVLLARLRLIRWLGAQPAARTRERRQALDARRRYLTMTLAGMLADRGRSWEARARALRALSLRPGHCLEVLRFLLSPGSVNA